jgi:hypothetical protein
LAPFGRAAPPDAPVGFFTLLMLSRNPMRVSADRAAPISYPPVADADTLPCQPRAKGELPAPAVRSAGWPIGLRRFTLGRSTGMPSRTDAVLSVH